MGRNSIEQKLLLPIGYAPSVEYFTLLACGDAEIDAAEHYVKQTWRNRCRLLSPQGVIELTVPVKQGAAEACPIRQVEISPHDRWQSRHLQAIKSCYNRTPYYEYYIDTLAPLYEKGAFRYLFDFCIALIEAVARLMQLPLRYRLCAEYRASAEPDYRALFDPSYLVMRKDFAPVPYYQLFEGQERFVPNLSILDLLFNMGPEARLILKQQYDMMDLCPSIK